VEDHGRRLVEDCVGKPSVVNDLPRPLGRQLGGASIIQAHHFVAENDEVVVQANGHNVTTAGKTYENTYCWSFRMRDGNMTELTEYATRSSLHRFSRRLALADIQPSTRLSSMQIRVAEKFLEPEFTQLQRTVFKGLQEHSPRLRRPSRRSRAVRCDARARGVVRRRCGSAPTSTINSSGGRSAGSNAAAPSTWPTAAGRSAPGRHLPALVRLCWHARAMGAVVVQSQHSVLNNPVIIAKLRLGFQVSGLSQSAQMGALVELSHHLSPARYAVFRSRFIPLTGTEA
jgi:hypothetical protein